MAILTSLALWMPLIAGAHADEYRIGVGDTLEVQVYGEEDMSGTPKVPVTCAISVALLGQVPVCGLTTGDAARAVENGLRDNHILVNPTVIVTVAEFGSRRVEVKGEVRTPGILVLDGITTLSQVITRAGGPTSGNVFEAEIISLKGEVRTFYLPDIEAMADPILVQPGDQVILKPPLYVQVIGEVEREGPVPFRIGLRVTEAIGLAGGPSQFASPTRAYILRGDGLRDRLNIQRIRRGRSADLELRPGDKLIVQKSIF